MVYNTCRITVDGGQHPALLKWETFFNSPCFLNLAIEVFNFAASSDYILLFFVFLYRILSFSF
jgi:hypothetical protein